MKKNRKLFKFQSLLALVASFTFLTATIIPQTSFAESDTLSVETAEADSTDGSFPDSTWWRMGLMIGGAGLIFGGMALTKHGFDNHQSAERKWGIALMSTGFFTFIGGILAPLFD